VAGGWRKLHKDKLYKLYTSPNVIRVIKSRRMIQERTCSTHEEEKNPYRVSVRKPERKSPLGRSGKMNVKMNHGEIE
jgi:hypothetical protein